MTAHNSLRASLMSAPQRYFDAIDAKDLDATMEQYADDATEIFLPVNLTYRGKDEIRQMYVDFFDATNDIKHLLRNVVVDEDQLKVGTEQVYIGDVKNTGSIDRYNCNFFEFDNGGKIVRVIIWRSDGNPYRD